MLKGTFLADFESFFTATQDAETGLHNIESASLATSAQINKMVDSFQGDKVIQQAAAMTAAVEKIGGAGMLTEKELAKVVKAASEATIKLKAMGSDVPESMEKYAGLLAKNTAATEGLVSGATKIAGAFGVAFTLDAVIGFGKSLMADADAMVKLSAQTGIAITDLQQLKFIAEQSGNTLDEMTSATSKLQASLDTVAGQDAIEKMGFDFRAFKAMDPMGQLRAMSDALREIPDPAEQARRAVDVFGQNGAKILATLKQDFDELGAAAPRASEASVRALEALGAAAGRWASNMKTAFLGVAGDAVLAGQQVWNNPKSLFAGLSLWLTQGAPAAISAMANVQAAANDAATAMANVKAPTGGAPTARGGSQETPREREERERKEAEAKREHEAATRKLAEATAELTVARSGASGVLSTMTADTIAAITKDLELGVAQATLATYYGKTAAQIKAVEDARKDGIEQAKKEVAAAKLVSEAWTDHYTFRQGLLGTTTQTEIAAIDAWKAKSLEALQETGSKNAAMYGDIETIARERLARVGINWDTVKEGSIAALRDTAERAATTYNVMVADSDQFTKAAIANAKTQRDQTAIELEKMAGDYGAMNASRMAREANFTAALAREDAARSKAPDASIEAYNKAMDEAIAKAQAWGISLEEAARILGTSAILGFTAVQTGAEQSKQKTDAATGAVERMSVALVDMGNKATNAYERAQAGLRMMEEYQAAGVFTGMDISGIASSQARGLARGGYQAVATDSGRLPIDTSAVWGRGGSTTTSNTLNVNVNNTDAGNIADKLVSEMRHNGMKF